MLDLLTNPATVWIVMGAAVLYAVARLGFGIRARFAPSRGRSASRTGTKPPDPTELASLLDETRTLATGLEASAATARTVAAELQADPSATVDPDRLDIALPPRYRGNQRKLERLPAPYGPLAALAARKAQGLRHRLFDPNWLPAQVREGTPIDGIYSRLAKDFDAAAVQARRLEKLIEEAAAGPQAGARSAATGTGPGHAPRASRVEAARRKLASGEIRLAAAVRRDPPPPEG